MANLLNLSRIRMPKSRVDKLEDKLRNKEKQKLELEEKINQILELY
jgi:predicted RNase H-like nuclease (RuvC/YqgF family)